MTRFLSSCPFSLLSLTPSPLLLFLQTVVAQKLGSYSPRAHSVSRSRLPVSGPSSEAPTEVGGGGGGLITERSPWMKTGILCPRWREVLERETAGLSAPCRRRTTSMQTLENQQGETSKATSDLTRCSLDGTPDPSNSKIPALLKGPLLSQSQTHLHTQCRHFLRLVHLAGPGLQ